ncbi:MAG TPA: 50S ribosomal protein L11 methyltransferase [Chroococcales cyanobacterium]
MSKYFEISITVPSIAQEAIAWKLGELGHPQLVLSERKPEETSDFATIKLYVHEKKDENPLPTIEDGLKELASILPAIEPYHLTLASVEEEDWAHSWKKYWHPQRIGRHIVVKPTWEAFQKEPGDLVLEIDPKQAFGTGTHPTTQLCLIEIENLFSSFSPEKTRVFDVGTGSGILAIAALKLGALSALAVDTDPIAVEATLENSELNGVSEKIEVIEGGVEKLSGQAELVVVNILAEVIAELAPGLAKAVAPGGLLVASGIIVSRASLVIEAFFAEGLTLKSRQEMGEWVRLTFSPA